MARPGVTQSEVFMAIQSLIEIGRKVTVESVRAELEHGSPNTINRHLRAWREKAPVMGTQESSIQVKQLKKQCAELEAQHQISLEQTEHLSREVLERDRKIARLEKELEEERRVLKEAQQEIEHLKSLYATIIQERRQMMDVWVNAQNMQIEQFREDLKAINQMNLSQIREISIHGQEAWLNEKVKVRELAEEIAQLKMTQEKLEQQILSEQQSLKPLRKRLKDQEQIIQHCLDPKKFENYKQDLRESS